MAVAVGCIVEVLVAVLVGNTGVLVGGTEVSVGGAGGRGGGGCRRTTGVGTLGGTSVGSPDGPDVTVGLDSGSVGIGVVVLMGVLVGVFWSTCVLVAVTATVLVGGAVALLVGCPVG